MIETNKEQAEGTLQEILWKITDEQRDLRKDIKKLIHLGIGAGIISGMAVLGLKLDHNKNYYELNQGVEYTQRQVEEIQQRSYIVVNPCAEQKGIHLYEVRECTTKTEK